MSNESRKSFGSVQPTTAATLIVSANPGRTSLTLRNAGSVTVYLGRDAAVTTATGYPLEAGEVLEDTDSIDAYYGIAASGTGDIRSIEVS